MIEDDYRHCAEFCLKVLAEPEGKFGGKDIGDIINKARREIANDERMLESADNDIDTRQDLRSMLRHCNEALALIEKLPGYATKDTGSNSPDSYEILTKQAGELLSILLKYKRKRSDPDAAGCAESVVREKLIQLGTDHIEEDLRTYCQQLRSLLTALTDTVAEF